MDQNMRMIMSKIGVEPVNDIPAASLLTQRDRVEEQSQDTAGESARMDEGGDFSMTPEEFEEALLNCTRIRGDRPVQTYPLAKKGRGNSTQVPTNGKGDKEN